MQTKNLEKTIGQIFDGSNKYIVPLYQRNFAWRQEQIEQLLQDVYEAFELFQNNNGGQHYFIGSLVVLKRNNGDYEVIDGQQRLTTLSLITKLLGINNEPRLFYDSRPEVEEFFQSFYKSENFNVNSDYSQVQHFRNAIDYIIDSKLKPNDLDIKLSTLGDSVKDKFKHYFSNNVYLVQVEIPADTDVAAYFEIMNNRGEQLQKHEILKSLLMEKLSSDSLAQTEFANIWNACSQMDIPIQKLFTADVRKQYFGEGYDSFLFNGLTFKENRPNDEAINNEIRDEKTDDKNGKSIDNIIEGHLMHAIEKDKNPEDASDADESEYKSIIDFPNFLMHVLKVLFPNRDIKLNEKFLLSTYHELEKEIKPNDFIKALFYLRTMFDNYIVKTITDNNDNEDGERWTLRKPHRYETSWKYGGTFGNEKDEVSVTHNQERVVKALSMLQVSFRSRIYKNWLYDILKWFNENKQVNVSYEDYIKKIDELICSKFNEIKYEWKAINSFDDESYKKGTDTPHFLFNFIDYLYWVNDTNSNVSSIKHFDFKYWNSVEHHMAREWAERNKDIVGCKDKYIDSLGNLCLISKSSNSRLSDRDVKEKVETFGKGNLGPNRQIMYNMTTENNMQWGEGQILQHYNDLVKLLNNKDDILGVSKILQ